MLTEGTRPAQEKQESAAPTEARALSKLIDRGPEALRKRAYDADPGFRVEKKEQLDIGTALERMVISDDHHEPPELEGLIDKLWEAKEDIFSNHTAPNRRRGKYVANFLMRLVQEEKNATKRIRREQARKGADNLQSYLAVEEYIYQKSWRQKYIRQLYVFLVLAETIINGDWKVNRDKEVGEMLGTISLPEVMKLVLRFYLENGYLKNTDPIEDGKLVYFDGGCGNGALLEWLRRNTETKPFEKENLRLIDFYGPIGFADRILYDLKELLRSLINPNLDEKERQAVDEFIEIVCTLVLQRAFFYKQSGNIAPKPIGNLAKDPNQIKPILENLAHFIPKVLDLDSVRADGEFIGDHRFTISSNCRDLFKKYFYAQASHTPKDFIEKYFVPGFRNMNLARKIPTDFHNVILGLFQTIDTQIAVEPLWNIASFCRSTSHLTNDEYREFMGKSCRYLKPGGIILDDGILESQTRDLRLQEILDIKAGLGDEFNFWVIKDKESPRISLLIQRGFPHIQGTSGYRFFDTKHLNLLISKKSQIFDIQSFAMDQTPTTRVVRLVTDRLKILFHTTLYGSPFKRTPLRSTGFQDMHGPILDKIREVLPHGDLDEGAIESAASHALGKIVFLIPEIRGKIHQELYR